MQTTIFLLSFLFFVNTSDNKIVHQQKTYQCLPCGYDCDNKTYSEPGKCSSCGMQLVDKSTIVFKTTDPATICDYVHQHPDAILLDVRTKAEYEGKANPNFGSLKNAINIPVQELNNRLAELKEYKNKEIIVYCSHSHRSPQAAYMLTQNGFANVTNMNGGMSAVKDNNCKQ